MKTCTIGETGESIETKMIFTTPKSDLQSDQLVVSTKHNNFEFENNEEEVSLMNK